MQQGDIKTLLEFKQSLKEHYGRKCMPYLCYKPHYFPKEFRLSMHKKFKLAMFRSSYYQKYGLDLNYIYSTNDVVTLCNRSKYNDQIVIRDTPLLIYDNLCKKYDSSLSVDMIHQLAGIASGKLTVNEYVNKLTTFISQTVVYGYNGHNTPIDSERQWEAAQCAIKSIDYVITNITWRWRG